ncbi:hypothetical protein BJ165DRAFT_1341367 [Panaeolus papilionaceus]|nr:hypothetical protein BJ165DRAFT_1341367 [Panaeolus papilionaceus]
MSSQQLRQAALGSVKNFRYRETQSLMRHLKKFGPLSETVPSTSSTQPTLTLPNPFLPKKHPKTGQWHEAKYSLRRQADLVKKANFTGTLDLLPPGPKKNAFQLRLHRLKEEKLKRFLTLKNFKPVEWDIPVGWVGEYKPRKVPGTQLGIRLYAGKKRMFKGHRWERLRLGVIKRRAMLVRDMQERVRNYKEYYKKRRPNPLKPSRYTKPPKLPF